MNKKQVYSALRKAANNAEFIKISDVAKALGVKPDTAKANYLRELEYLPNGHSKLYIIDDVANAILKEKKI